LDRFCPNGPDLIPKVVTLVSQFNMWTTGRPKHLPYPDAQKPKWNTRQPDHKVKPIALSALITNPRACPFEIAEPISVCPATEWAGTVL
jgi:hypothetical protein